MAAHRRFFGALLMLLLLGWTASARADGLDRGKGGPALGGGAGSPRVPGRSGATGEALRRERRARLERLRRLQPSAPPGVAVSPSAPSPRPVQPGGRAQPTAPAPTREASLVHLHHGSVRMIAGLARVDLTLEVQNVGSAPLEWARTYAIDARAEVIGASLKRDGEAAIRARTLTTEDALRVYARIRTPPRRRTRQPRNRDPLLVSRERNDRLRIQIWPIAPQETVRVEITFVTPLRGQGARRTYVDVMGGAIRHESQQKSKRNPKNKPTPRLSRPDKGNDPTRRPPTMVDSKADWLIQPGELVLSATPATGMTLSGQTAGKLQFTGLASTTPDKPAPHVPFLTTRRTPVALLVGGRSLAGRIATWRFDPRAYVARKGFTFHAGLTIRLSAPKTSCRRLAPATILASADPVPVTALVSRGAGETLTYHVEILDRDGVLVVQYDEQLPLERKAVDPALQGAVSGWHRAQLVRRVFGWADTHADDRAAANRFAVDMGVLMPGSSAIAIPSSERARLTPELRRLYSTDGVPLGAQRHEADWRAPPHGSLTDR